MEFFRENRRFSEFTLGWISFGIGQQLTRVGLIQPWAKGTSISLVLGMLGLLLFLVGLFFMGRLLFWLLQHYNQDNRVWKVFGRAVGITFISGIVIGLIGQLVYDHSSVSYLQVKSGMWLVTSILQSLIKVTTIYVLVTFYKEWTFSWRNRQFQRLLVITCGVTLFVATVSLALPTIAPILLMISDTVTVLGSLYYLIQKT